MKNTPVDYQTARKIIDGYGLPDFGKATIREVVAISTQLEQETKTEFIHMEMGVPGLKAAQVGVDAEIKALQDGVASIYPNINGTSDVKAEASRFIKAFIDIDIAPEGCVPVTGSMQGTYASFLVCGQCTPGKDTILFIDPGFPVQKQQITVMGYRYESFDVYEYRGEKLRDILATTFARCSTSRVLSTSSTWSRKVEAAETCTMRIEAALGNEPVVQRFLTEALETTECPPKARKELRLAVEELFVNVARYAYDPGSGDVEVSVSLASDGCGARVVLRDGGVPFDPFGHADPEAPRSVEEAPIGGLGIMMVKRLMDAHSYRYVDGCNEVTIAKRW